MIRTTQLGFAYPSAPMIQFPDVEVDQGAVLLLSGPSGCGKSTWLALLAGLLHASQGHLVVAGQNLAELGPSQRDAWRARTIGFLPQNLHLSAALTIAQNLELAHWAAGQPPNAEALAQALRALEVEDLAHRKPAQISGGQAQRVALARAILLRPRVILADEPTGSLDDAAANSALNLLLVAAAMHNATLVIATHDARVAAWMGNRTHHQGVRHLHLKPLHTGALV